MRAEQKYKAFSEPRESLFLIPKTLGFLFKQGLLRKPCCSAVRTQALQGVCGQSIFPSGRRLRRRLILAVLLPLDPHLQRQILAFAIPIIPIIPPAEPCIWFCQGLVLGQSHKVLLFPPTIPLRQPLRRRNPIHRRRDNAARIARTLSRGVNTPFSDTHARFIA